MKKYLALILALVMALSLAACGGSSGSSAKTDSKSDSAELPTLRVAAMPFITSLPTYYIQQNNLGEKYGFKMDVTMFATGAPMNEALAADLWDVGAMGAAAVTGVANYDEMIIGEVLESVDGLGVFSMTANAIKGVREKYLKAGFDDYISKPIEGRKLEEMILRYLDPSLLRTEKDVPQQTENRIECPVPEPAKADIMHFHLPETGLPEMEEFDFEYAMKLLGDADLLRLLLDDFKEFLGESMEKLQNCWKELPETKALDNYRIEVHAVKSTAATVGALLLSKLARLLELAAKEGNLERMERLHPILLEEMKAHKERLEEAPWREEKTK